ncbi:hypothetical protein [Streptomyces noursei]|uniref:hypothetical protein n=1 Tax=Streptomyces noursei TaxID=1971 RepID=UPI0038125405
MPSSASLSLRPLTPLPGSGPRPAVRRSAGLGGRAQALLAVSLTVSTSRGDAAPGGRRPGRLCLVSGVRGWAVPARARLRWER